MSDTATVTGAGATPTGTASFFLCQPATVTANGGSCSAGGEQVGAAGPQVTMGWTPAPGSGGGLDWAQIAVEVKAA